MIEIYQCVETSLLISRIFSFKVDHLYNCFNLWNYLLSLKIPPTCCVELSLKGFEFLNFLFKKYDKDNDGCLNKQELDDLFSVCPINIPWGNDVHNTIETNRKNQITYCGFLSQWV